MPSAPDILVRGGGAVGLTAALALGRLGLGVAVLGRRRAGGDEVRTYALNPASVALLRQLRVWDALPEDARTPVYDMHIEGDGGAVLEFSAWQQQVQALAWIVDAAALEATLAAAIRFAPHVTEVDAELPCALTVLAEGRDSAARQRLGVAMPLAAYGQRAVAARLLGERPHGGTARQWFRSPDVLALLPFDRPARGHGWGLVWSLPEARAAELLAMPAADFEAALAAATQGAAGTLRLAGERAAWPLARGDAETVCGPGWVLVGDAAHVIHPLAGQGLNLGLADVQALSQVLGAREPWRPLGDARLLARYARERAAPTRAMGHVTDALLHLFAAEPPIWKELRNRGLGLVNRLPPLKRFLTARALDA